WSCVRLPALFRPDRPAIPACLRAVSPLFRYSFSRGASASISDYDMDIGLQFHCPFILAVWRSNDVDLCFRDIISHRLDSRRCARADSLVMVANWFAWRLDSW